jgi:hypothetical protein
MFWKLNLFLSSGEVRELPVIAVIYFHGIQQSDYLPVPEDRNVSSYRSIF